MFFFPYDKLGDAFIKGIGSLLFPLLPWMFYELNWRNVMILWKCRIYLILWLNIPMSFINNGALHSS